MQDYPGIGLTSRDTAVDEGTVDSGPLRADCPMGDRTSTGKRGLPSACLRFRQFCIKPPSPVPCSVLPNIHYHFLLNIRVSTVKIEMLF